MSEQVTCLLPVYNASTFLKESIQSIICQSFTHFRLLIIDDGSTDTSSEIIQSFNDPRITVLRNEKNSGLIFTLNRGLEQISTKYLIRMDADDICEKDRFKRLVEFMDQHPEIWVAGSQIRYFGKQQGMSALPIQHNAIKANLIFRNCLAHPSVIMKTDCLSKLNIKYETEFIHAEDYRMWTKIIMAGGKLGNLQDVLLNYRVEGQNISLNNFDKSFGVTQHIWKDFLEFCGFKMTGEDLKMHGVLSGIVPYDPEQKEELFAYLKNFSEQIKLKSPEERYEYKKVLDLKLDQLFFKICDKDKETVKRFWKFRKWIKLKELRYWIKK